MINRGDSAGPAGGGINDEVCFTLTKNDIHAVLPGTPQPGAANDNRPAITAGKPLTFISMFSGIEAASLAFGPLGWKPICFAEIENFPSSVLAHHYPDVPNVGDMSNHDWSQYAGKVDIVCGGPPCQDFSVAGLRAGLDGSRGNLSITYMRALHAIKPRNAIVENVPGWLNDKKNAFGCFLAGLVGADDALCPPGGGSWPNAGMVAGPWARAAWRVLDAQYFNLAQRRRRVLVVADFGTGADPAAVLFEPEGVFRHSPPSRESGEGTSADVAPSLVASGRGVERTGDTRGQDPVVAVYAPEIARCVATREGTSQDYETTTMVAQCVTGDITHTLKAEGFDASEDGTGRGNPIVGFQGRGSNLDLGQDVTGTLSQNCDRASGGAPCVAFTSKDYGADAAEELSPTLRAGGFTGSHANGGVMPAIAQTVAIRGREGGATAELGGEVATALRASQGGGDKPHVLVFGIARDALDRSGEGAGGSAGERSCLGILEEQSPTLKAKGPNAVAFNARQDPTHGPVADALGTKDNGHGILISSAVRRLTPRECERLQGFQWRCSPDYPGAWQDETGRWWSPDYTRIPMRRYKARKITRTRPADMWESDGEGGWLLMSADGPRYKSLGNSWAVPKFIWLGERIARFMPSEVAANDNLAAVDDQAA